MTGWETAPHPGASSDDPPAPTPAEAGAGPAFTAVDLLRRVSQVRLGAGLRERALEAPVRRGAAGPGPGRR